ncbi:ABC transporter substrate-binding protein [Variovorax paradoxus]|jgi:branched-chain amino acid transport system substrate-binding protein|uniref:ABC transporter substrate-binding protein n=1 Tax=Variovorax paradoxus TaxID=34073 RepID=UPI00037F9369|nr:ABC transporter substrate-binding protein [Variovorax paradoxus]
MKRIAMRRAVVTLLAAAVVPVVGAQGTNDPVRLGVMLPLTGPAALAGSSILEGIRFAADEANAKGGVNGRKVQLFIENDEGSSTKGVTAVRKLVESDRVVAISGTYVSAVALAASKVAREFKVPMVSAGSTSSNVTDANTSGDPWFFRAFPGSDEQAEQSARDIVKKLNAKKVALIQENSIYGSSLAEQMKKVIPQYGGQIVGVEAYNPDERDFYSVLTKIRTKQPDAIYIAGLMDAGAQIIKQSREAGLKAALVGSGSMMSDKLIELAGPASEGFAVSSMFEPSTPNKVGQAFTASWRQKMKKEPDVYSALGYDSMHLLIEAARRAPKVDGASMQSTLKGMKDVPLVQGPDGTVAKFDDKGSCSFKIGLAVVRNGKRQWLPFD